MQRRVDWTDLAGIVLFGLGCDEMEWAATDVGTESMRTVRFFLSVGPTPNRAAQAHSKTSH